MEGVEDFLKKHNPKAAKKVSLPVAPKIKDVRGLSDAGLSELKEKFFLAMVTNWGNVSKSCAECGMTRGQYKYLLKDEQYKKRLEEAEFKEMYKDFVEWQLTKLIKMGDRNSVIFASKTLLKDRGYVERREVTGKDGSELQQINVKIINTEKTKSDTHIEKNLKKQARDN